MVSDSAVLTSAGRSVRHSGAGTEQSWDSAVRPRLGLRDGGTGTVVQSSPVQSSPVALVEAGDGRRALGPRAALLRFVRGRGLIRRMLQRASLMG